MEKPINKQFISLKLWCLSSMRAAQAGAGMGEKGNLDSGSGWEEVIT